MEPIADVEVQSEAPAPKRRKLVFEDVETFVFHGVDLQQPAEVNTKKAAKAWAASKGLSVGDWRSCRLTVRGTETVGTCLAHDNCPRRYRCYGNMKDGQLSLQVAAANDCNAAHPRQARRAIKAQQEAQPSVEERQKILQACDSLLEEQLKVTPANVLARAGIKIKGSCLRAIVRHRRTLMGGTTPRFKSSAEGFQAFVDERSSGNHPLCFLQTSIGANMFGWIAVIQPLMDWFQELHGKQGFTNYGLDLPNVPPWLPIWVLDGGRAPMPWRIMEAKCIALGNNLWAARSVGGVQARLCGLAKGTHKARPATS